MKTSKLNNLEDLGCARCIQCVHYRNCRRMDGKVITPYRPYFSSLECALANHIICSDFFPKKSSVVLHDNWPGFEKYWNFYVHEWLPYQKTDKLLYFFIDEDMDEAYGIPLMDYVYGRHIDFNTGKLNAVEKMYYKRAGTGFGYILNHIPIKGYKFPDDKLDILKEYFGRDDADAETIGE